MENGKLLTILKCFLTVSNMNILIDYAEWIFLAFSLTILLSGYLTGTIAGGIIVSSWFIFCSYAAMKIKDYL